MKQYFIVILCFLGYTAQSQMAYLYTAQDSVMIGDAFEVKLEFSGIAPEDIVKISWDTLDKLQFIDYTDTSLFDLDFEMTMGKFTGDNYIYEKGELNWDRNEEASPPSFYNTFEWTVWEMCVLGIPGPTVTLADGQEFTINPRYLLVKDPLLDEMKELAPSLGIIKERVTFYDILMDYIWWLILLVAIIAVYFLSRYYKAKQKLKASIIPEPEPEPIVLIPAHKIALEKLQTLKKERTWEHGSDKAYVSSLTEIIREYIENRFGVLALEMTTSEITSALRNDILSEDQLGQLSNTLNVSDLIKFAKAKADSNLYEQFVDDAIDLVENTKQEEIIEPKSDEE